MSDALPLAGSAPDVFVGRREELGWLAGALQDSMHGHPRVVLLRGEAGIGKTRLLRELRRVALRSDVATCLGRAYEDVAIPYLPFEPLFEEIGRRALHATPSAAGDIAVVRELLRGGAARSQSEGRRAAEPAEEALAVFPAACRATLELARRRPTLVILDDLHWADQASLHLFAHLVFGALDAGLQGPLRLMLVAAHRPLEPTHRLASVVARIEREAIGCTLEVGGLRSPELGELVAGITLAVPSRDLLAKVSRATRGNPLYVREMILSLAKRGLIRGEQGRLEADAKLPDLSVPEQITRAVAARAENLTEECRRALFLASFLGDRFSAERLAALGGWDADALLDVLQEGARHGFLAADGDDFVFDHSLVRQAFQADTPGRRRRQIHAQIAALLAREAAGAGGAVSREIAQHLLEADDAADPAELARHARLAGDAARQAQAQAEAAGFYEAALAAGRADRGLPAGGARGTRAPGRGREAGHGRRREPVWRISSTRSRSTGASETCAASPSRSWTTPRPVRVLRFVPYGSSVDAGALEEAAQLVGDRDPRLRASIWVATANVHFSARRPEEAKRSRPQGRPGRARASATRGSARRRAAAWRSPSSSASSSARRSRASTSASTTRGRPATGGRRATRSSACRSCSPGWGGSARRARWPRRPASSPRRSRTGPGAPMPRPCWLASPSRAARRMRSRDTRERRSPCCAGPRIPGAGRSPCRRWPRRAPCAGSGRRPRTRSTP